MDPSTSAIVAVLPGLASDLVSKSVKDAYEALKALIHRKWGKTGPVPDALSELEAHPKSHGQATVLADRLAAANATSDEEIMLAVSKLADALRGSVGEAAKATINLNISGGTQGIAGAQNVSIGSMTVGRSPPSSDD
jgi:hypothetical protein